MRDARLIGLRRDHIDVVGQLARYRFENCETGRMNAVVVCQKDSHSRPFPPRYTPEASAVLERISDLHMTAERRRTIQRPPYWITVTSTSPTRRSTLTETSEA